MLKDLAKNQEPIERREEEDFHTTKSSQQNKIRQQDVRTQAGSRWASSQSILPIREDSLSLSTAFPFLFSFLFLQFCFETERLHHFTLFASLEGKPLGAIIHTQTLLKKEQLKQITRWSCAFTPLFYIEQDHCGPPTEMCTPFPTQLIQSFSFSQIEFWALFCPYFRIPVPLMKYLKEHRQILSQNTPHFSQRKLFRNSQIDEY